MLNLLSPVGAINDNNLHLLVALLVPLQQLLADVGGELEVPLLLLEEPGDGLDILIGPDMRYSLVRSDILKKSIWILIKRGTL